ncbi:MAG: glycoside hydrolase family 57 protein [archaeon]
MADVCFYFQVHQPFRLRHYTVFDIGNKSDYFDEKKNKEIMKKVARKCYLPTNNLMLELIQRHKGKFKIAYSITGVAIEQFEKYAPEVLESFKELAKTGCVEFLSETYYHTLSFLYSKKEFQEQVEMHKKMIKKHFNQEPIIFRNTELIYNNELANFVENLGFKGILAEGADHILEWRSPNFIYKSKTTNQLKLLLKNYKLSDDIAFRFGEKTWKEHPLTSEKFADWVGQIQGHSVNLFMDYETFGEHQWDHTGIFNFMSHLPDKLFEKGINFKLPSELLDMEPVSELDIHNFVSWADVERDTSAWLGNSIQQAAIKELYLVEKAVKQSKDPKLLEEWRKLQTSDHFYYMCTKWFNDGDVHKYFNPYKSPYDAYITFLNVLNDIIIRLKMREKTESLEAAKSQGFRISDAPSSFILD